MGWALSKERAGLSDPGQVMVICCLRRVAVTVEAQRSKVKESGEFCWCWLNRKRFTILVSESLKRETSVRV